MNFSYEGSPIMQQNLTPEDYIKMDQKYNAQNYHSIPFVCSRGEGPFLYDTTGRKCFDFLACYSAANQGHAHPKIVAAAQKQMARLPICSRAFYSDVLAVYTKYITDYFGYQRILPMNTGVEGVETAVKLARKWAYEKKGVPKNSAVVIFPTNNFWGRSIAACSSSTDPECYTNFGPYTPGFVHVPYNDLKALGETLEKYSSVAAAFVVEPVQGEAGVIIPDAGYLKGAYELCRKHKLLLICDEVQTGLGRVGDILCSRRFGVRPDVIVLGKALSGGLLPVSAVLADDEVMLTIKPGQHGSTYGGCLVGGAAAMAALQVLKDENLSENAEKMGQIFREKLNLVKSELPFIVDVRGIGLMNAIEVKSGLKYCAWDICIELMNAGVLCKPTHDTIIRFTPPLVINEIQMSDACSIITNVLMTFKDRM